MAFSIIYRNLFEIVFRHDYLLNQGDISFEDIGNDEIKERKIKKYNIHEILSIEPTRETLAYMKGLGLVFRTTATGFFVALKVNAIPTESDAPDYAPFTAIPEGAALRFLFRARDPYFLNYTNLPLQELNARALFFSNTSGSDEVIPPIQLEEPSEQERIPSLSRPIAEFNAGDTYSYSALVREGGNTFLSKFNGLTQSPSTAPASWKSIAGAGFVNEQDFSSLYPIRVAPDPNNPDKNTLFLRYYFPEGGINSAELSLQSLDGTELARQEVERGEEDRPIQEIEFNAGPIDDGRYRLIATGEKEDSTEFEIEEDVLLNSQLSTTPALGYIEIINDRSLGAYALLDDENDGTLLSPRFGIQFLNRHTFWRYNYQNELTSTPGADLEEVDGQFVTSSIQPLTTSYIRITDGIEDLLPNPGVGMIKPEDTRVYSDIFIHN